MRMLPNARPFSVFDFIWCEIKQVGERPIKGCGFAPYITDMIHHVAGDSFQYDKEHKYGKIVPIKDEIDIPLLGEKAAAGAEAKGDLPPGETTAGVVPSPRCSYPRRQHSP